MLRWAALLTLKRGNAHAQAAPQRGLLGNDVPDLFRLLMHRGYKKQANEVIAHMSCITIPYSHSETQIRAGNVLQLHNKLYVVVKSAYTQGAGRQLGNVTVRISTCQQRPN